MALSNKCSCEISHLGRCARLPGRISVRLGERSDLHKKALALLTLKHAVHLRVIGSFRPL